MRGRAAVERHHGPPPPPPTPICPSSSRWALPRCACADKASLLFCFLFSAGDAHPCHGQSQTALTLTHRLVGGVQAKAAHSRPAPHTHNSATTQPPFQESKQPFWASQPSCCRSSPRGLTCLVPVAQVAGCLTLCPSRNAPACGHLPPAAPPLKSGWKNQPAQGRRGRVTAGSAEKLLGPGTACAYRTAGRLGPHAR